MKTTLTNAINFPDQKGVRLCNTLKKIFPKENLEVVLWYFYIEPISQGHYKIILEIDINYVKHSSQRFTYTTTTSDMTLIDKIKADEQGVIKRKTIEYMICHDTFIEELDEFLERIKPVEVDDYEYEE